MGCSRIVGYAWGAYLEALVSNSPVVEFIIEQAREYSPENKLDIMCLGAVTNVAAAILQNSDIAKNVRLYVLSMKNDTKGNWNKNSFNARNDLNGLDIILNNKD